MGRPFLASKDTVQRIEIDPLFFGSSVFATSPIEVGDVVVDQGIVHDQFGLYPFVLEGPLTDLLFFYNYLTGLIPEGARSLDTISEYGEWVAIYPPFEAPCIKLLFQFGYKPISVIELVERRFRRDAVTVANLRLSDISVLTVYYKGTVASKEFVSLPDDKNGDIAVSGLENATPLIGH